MKKLNKENIQDIFALTPLQEGMLLYYLQDPQSDYYFEQLSLEISGNIDFDIFEKSWNFVIETNEMLRAVFRWEKVGNPVQIILKEYKLQPRYCDFTGKTSNDLQNQLKEIKAKDRKHKFDLREVPFRVILSKISQNRYHMLISNHHILYDGWSTGIILKEFFQAYESLSMGSQPLVPIVKPGFKEFIQWHQEQDRIKQKKYWQNYLEGFDTPTRLPIKRSKAGAGYTGERNYRLHLNQADKDKLEVFVKERRITLAAVFYCAWGVLLQKYCGMEDVVFGINVSGRSAPIRGIENMVGLFINTVPLRVRSEPGENWRGFLVRINKHMAANEKYDNTPLVDIYSYCRQFIQAGEELFDSLVSVENYPLDSYLKESGPHLSIQSYSMEERPHYDLSLVISTTEGINIDFIYKNTSFDKETVVRLAHHFSNILKGIVENIENRPQEIEILSGKEKQQLLVDFNRTAADYPGEKTICRLFEEQVERAPDHVALTGPKLQNTKYKIQTKYKSQITNNKQNHLTYKELNEKSNGLAILLIEKGVQPDTIVGIMIERSVEMIIGILGILKAGGAYLPVDPGFPQERIDYILKDSNARILLSEVSEESKVSEGTEIVSLSELSEEFPTHLTHLTHPTQLCYIIYTSGSTGKPKGVLIQHGSVVNRLNWMQQMYPLGGDDIILQKTPFTFDVSVWELFWWSFYGARLCLLGPGEEKDPAAIIKSIAGYHITTIHFVPSMLNAFLAYLESSRESYRCIGLRRLFASGEALGASQVERFYSLLTVKGKCRVKLINLYGPTEAAIDVSYYNCCVGHRFDTVTVPIGKPIHNIRLFVVNINMGLQPIGIAGELCIAGVGLARGYLNRPQLTAEKFDHDLWDYHGALAAGGKLYRTGDLARWLSDGNIEFLGRIDYQVKIRGFRVELGEIENQFLEHPAVRDVAVLSLEDIDRDKYLAAYFVSDRDLSDEELREHLLKDLPDYMIPAYFVRLEKIPLTPSGKVDRGALPAPEVKEIAAYAAPRDEIEKKLAKIWAVILGRDISLKRIGIDENFFRLGGHSLKATSLASWIYKEFNVKIPLGEIFKRPTIRGISRYIDEAVGERYVSVEPVEKKEYYMLSSAQKRLYFLQQLDNAGIAYNISAAWVLEGIINKPRLEKSIRMLIRRHESFRTSFVIIGEEPVQRIHDAVEEGPFGQGLNARGEDLAAKDAKAPSFIRPFDLSRAPLLRVGLGKLEDDRHLLMVDMHHIISDGISIEILAGEFSAFLAGRELPSPGFHYKDYAAWQGGEKKSKNLREQKEFWLKEFADEIPILDLPTDFRRPAIQSFAGDYINFELDREITGSIKALSLENGTTLYMQLLALYTIFTAKISGREDIVTGTPVAGRRHADLEKIIGMFVNTLALRNYPSGEKKYVDFLGEIKERTLNAFENQDYQYEDLVEEVIFKRDASRNPLFDIMFALQNNTAREPVIPGLKAIPYRQENKTSKFDLTLTGMEVEEKLLFTFEYSTKLFKRKTVERFIAYFVNIVRGVIENSRKKISDFNIITEAEKRRILFDFNDTEREYPKDKTIHRVFEEQVERRPDQIAIVGTSIQITYGEFNKRANRLGRLLRSKGAGTNRIVGLMIERSIEMMVGILGILKSGGAYLPIDTAYPPGRIQYMLEDSKTSILLVMSNLDGSIKFTGEVIDINTGCSDCDTRNLEIMSSSRDMVYMIYTSGSTGRPKGVMVKIGSFLNLLHWYLEEFAIGENENILLTAPIGFDLAQKNLFSSHMVGGRLTLAPPGIPDYRELSGIIHKERVTLINCAPSVFYPLIELNGDGDYINLKSLRAVILGGETIQVDKLLGWVNSEFYRSEIINTYGPTECTDIASFYRLPPETCQRKEIIPIGKPISNVKIYILDKYRNVLPIGISGELYIGGTGLAKGYFENIELTAEKFVEVSHLPGKKVYRTGDLSRWLADGVIEFLGRIDQQVKIRGFRIELGEIEHCLLKVSGVKNALVVVREEVREGKYICAYVVSDREYGIAELREFLSKELPAYMLPSYFIRLGKIPLTPNGKVDRRALPGPEASLREDAGYVPPSGAVEKKLVEVWGNVLVRTNIGINENFFMIGGDSIKAIQVISRMSRAGYKLEMKDLFKYPVISDLAFRVKKLKRLPDQSPITGTIPLIPIQKEFFNGSHSDPHHYNQSVMLYSKEGFDKEAIRKVFARIQEHHDALRMTYKRDESSGGVIQFNHGLGYSLYLEEHDLRNRDNCFDELKAKANGIQASIHLENGPLMKPGLFHLDDGDRLLIAVHHLVIDGVSWRILFEDIEALYGRYKRGEKLTLPLKTDSFKLWSETLSAYANDKTFLKEKAYWQKIESVDASAFSISKDFHGDDNYIKDTGSLSFTPGDEQVGLLLTGVNRAFRTEINDILLTALGLGIKKTFGRDRVLVMLEGHGREEILEGIDISRTVGWFTCVYPVLLDISHADDPGRQIKEIKETLRRVPNKGIGYGILKYLTHEENKKEIQFKLKPQISFNYLGQFDADVKQKSSFEPARESTGNLHGLNNRREYLLDVSGMIANNRLTLTVSFNKTHFKPETMARLIGNFQSELTSIITFCSSREKIEWTPSDFTYGKLTIDRLQQLLEVYPDVEDIYTLSPMQEGFLFHALMDRSSYSYFEQTAFRLHGELDILLVEKSLNELVNRHDILRTAFIHKDTPRPVQVVLKNRPMNFYYEDISKIGGEREKEFFIKEYKEKDKQRSFDLSKDGLMRAAVFRLSSTEYQFIWSHHHILMDGWCIGILNTEFFEIYTGYLENRHYRLPAVKPYRLYIQWLEKQDREESVRYWENYLDSYEEGARVPVPGTEILKKEGGGYKKETVSVKLSGEKTAALNRLAAGNHVTLNTVTLALWGILLGKYNGKEDVVFGTVVSGRPLELQGVESMVGLFINAIPVRIHFEEEMKFYQLIQQVQGEALACEPYHYCPLAEIQSRTALKQNLIDHIFVFENYPIAEKIEGCGKERNESNKIGLKLSDVEVFEQTNYDFNIVLAGTDELKIKFLYNGNIYDRDYIELVAGHFLVAVDTVIEDQGVAIRELTILTEEEKNRILFEFNDTEAGYPKNKTISRLFEEQAERTPDHVVLVGEKLQNTKYKLQTKYKSQITNYKQKNISITYRELNNQSNRLAHILTGKGVQPDTIVGIMTERSIEMIIGIVGILKAGGAYLPIDPEYPQERIDYMLTDSAARLLVTTGDISSSAFSASSAVKNLLPAAGCRQPAASLAYIIYTSGTTGRPKGSLIEHRNVVRLLFNDKFQFDFTDRDIWTLFHSFCFDFSVWEMYGALLFGGKLLIVPKMVARDTAAFLELLNREAVTVLNQTPPAFYNLLNEALTSPGQLKKLYLKYVIFGGEALNPLKLKDWPRQYPRTRLINMFGITETTVHVTFKEITEEDIELNISNIGKPIPTLNAYILDRYLKPVPVGVTGEICVGGGGVCRGYLNRVELTEEKFDHDKNQKLLRGVQGGSNRSPLPGAFLEKSPPGRRRLYKSGDLARFLENGDLEYLGRIDHQVKIRGYRVELGEIESRLLTYGEIKDAVVLAEGTPGEKYLCAYIAAHKELALTGLRTYLSAKLPDYMIPSYFVRLETIPLTSNGKVDRKALPKPGLNVGDSYTAPRNEIEKKLAALWSEILGSDVTRVSQLQKSIGIDDNFFDVGGHSLKAALLVSVIHRELRVKIPLGEVFKRQTIRRLSEYIRGSKEVQYAGINNVEVKEYYPLSSSQGRLYFIHRLSPGGTAYNMPQVVGLEGAWAIQPLRDTFNQLISRHESLRTSFHMIDGWPVQRTADKITLSLEFHNLESHGSIHGAGGNQDGIIKDFIRPFDLSKSPLIRAGIIKTGEKKHILMVDMHHIISDVISMNILIRDFMDLYAGKDLPRLRLQYKDFSGWENKPAQKAVIKKQEEYWLKELSGELPVVKIPTDFPKPGKWSYRGGRYSFEINEKETGALREMARREEATMHMLLLAIYTVLLAKLSGQEDIIVAISIAGRRHADLENIIGIFLNMLLIRNYPGGEKSFNEFLREVRLKVLSAYDNQDYQFEELVEKVKINVKREMNQHPLTNVQFGLQNMDMSAIDIPGLTLVPYRFDNWESKVDLLLLGTESEEKLDISIEYNMELFKEETIQRFGLFFKNIVTGVIENPDGKIKRIEVLFAEEKNGILLKRKKNEEAIRIDFDL